ncbi:MAG: ATP-binding protein [Planctomycetes bacterium]|nr:ATP-binding protein [Planctomycetota bacterium]
MVNNDTAQLSLVRDFVKDGIRNGGFPEENTNRIMVAVDEAITNVVEHAFAGVPVGEGEIHIKQTVDAKSYCITIEDNGLSFNKQSIKEIDIKKHVSEGNTGGLGIFFMRQVMDVVDYQYEHNVCNRLMLIKYASEE